MFDDVKTDLTKDIRQCDHENIFVLGVDLLDCKFLIFIFAAYKDCSHSLGKCIIFFHRK